MRVRVPPEASIENFVSIRNTVAVIVVVARVAKRRMQMISFGMVFGEERLWSINEVFPLRYGEYTNVEDMEVTGQELELIKKNFSNLPSLHSTKTIFVGETAKFLAANLRVLRQDLNISLLD